MTRQAGGHFDPCTQSGRKAQPPVPLTQGRSPFVGLESSQMRTLRDEESGKLLLITIKL